MDPSRLTVSEPQFWVIYSIPALENRDGDSQGCNKTARICCFFVGRDSGRRAPDKAATILQLLIDERTPEDIKQRPDSALVILQLFRCFGCIQLEHSKEIKITCLGFHKNGLIIQVNAHKGRGNLTSQMFLKLLQVPVLLFSKH